MEIKTEPNQSEELQLDSENANTVETSSHQCITGSTSHCFSTKLKITEKYFYYTLKSKYLIKHTNLLYQ